MRPSPETAVGPGPIRATGRRSTTSIVMLLGKAGSAFTSRTSGKGLAAATRSAWLTLRVVISSAAAVSFCFSLSASAPVPAPFTSTVLIATSEESRNQKV
jgi:hypothetical protein